MINSIRKNAVLFYFVTTCAISWLCLLPIIGLNGFTGKTVPSDDAMPLLFLAMCSGPVIAGLLSIFITEGKYGYKKLIRRLITWKIKFRFYIIALFTAPVFVLLAHLILSFFIPDFTLTIFSSEEQSLLIIGGIVGGIVAGFCEELGWTGFAIPKLRLKYSMMSTGLLVGFVWGIWHFPLFMNKDPMGNVPLLILVLVKTVTHLPPYRVLMTWVYDQTKSLLIIILMHMSLTASALIFQPNSDSGISIVIGNLVLASLFYSAIVAVTFLAKR